MVNVNCIYIFIILIEYLSNPNAPRRVSYMTDGPKEWLQYQVDWPEYNIKNETYFNLSELFISLIYFFYLNIFFLSLFIFPKLLYEFN